MKLVFTKSNLNKAVGIVMKAVPTRTTMNILECILIDATTNEIKFTGNDMELGIDDQHRRLFFHHHPAGGDGTGDVLVRFDFADAAAQEITGCPAV